ncbi:MAG: hypothetical protein KDD00_02385 [Ignavibacteriae bacterium]|nr:hypothetical protein [Ignavibacteriota bacterium]
MKNFDKYNLKYLSGILLILLSGVLIISCTKTKEDNTKSEINSLSGDTEGENLSSAGVKEGGHEFSVHYQMPRRIFRLDKEDLNNDGIKEIIVMSVLKDTVDKYNDYYNFDMIEVFSLDSEKQSYVKILSDTVDYSKECNYAELSDDKSRQILVVTNSGGNDSITSGGMFVFEMISKDSINLLKYFETGAPSVKDLKNDGKNELVVSDLFYGVMPPNNAVSYVSGIYRIENHELVQRNSDYPEFYDTEIDGLKENYYGLKKKVEMGMQPVNLAYPLYREASEIIVNYYSKGDMINLKKFWDEEKNDLKKNIEDTEFLDLNNFVLKLLPSATNA